MFWTGETGQQERQSEDRCQSVEVGSTLNHEAPQHEGKRSVRTATRKERNPDLNCSKYKVSLWLFNCAICFSVVVFFYFLQLLCRGLTELQLSILAAGTRAMCTRAAQVALESN